MVVENLHSCQDVMIVCQRAKAEVAPYFVGSYHQEMAKELLIIILGSNMIPYFIANEIWYTFVFQICDFDNNMACVLC